MADQFISNDPLTVIRDYFGSGRSQGTGSTEKHIISFVLNSLVDNIVMQNNPQCFNHNETSGSCFAANPSSSIITDHSAEVSISTGDSTTTARKIIQTSGIKKTKRQELKLVSSSQLVPIGILIYLRHANFFYI